MHVTKKKIWWMLLSALTLSFVLVIGSLGLAAGRRIPVRPVRQKAALPDMYSESMKDSLRYFGSILVFRISGWTCPYPCCLPMIGNRSSRALWYRRRRNSESCWRI